MGSILGPICIQILLRNHKLENERIRIAKLAIQIRFAIVNVVSHFDLQTRCKSMLALHTHPRDMGDPPNPGEGAMPTPSIAKSRNGGTVFIRINTRTFTRLTPSHGCGFPRPWRNEFAKITLSGYGLTVSVGPVCLSLSLPTRTPTTGPTGRVRESALGPYLNG